MLKQRVITASILFVLFLVALFGLPAVGWQLLVLAVIWQGGVEWARLSGLSGRAATAYWLLTLAMMAGMLWFDNTMSAEWQTMLHQVWYMLAVLLWVFVVPAWLIAGWHTSNAWFMGVIGWIVLLPTGLAMIDLRVYDPWALLFVMTLVMVADISAYFAGKRFGKNKLAPAISPGKTWEGVIGALIGVSIFVVVVGWASGLYRQYPVFPAVIVAGWWWVGLAVIGDLFES
ncbi:MAG: phosphatidate cytidylyltransferase, partial [Gallionellaceae bacterium]|nr:phosphatidate cytidylyltransferase [Gallionellaceae bacterium]